MMTAVQDGKSFSDAATIAGVTPKLSPRVTRNEPNPDIPPELQRVLFGLKQGEATMVEIPDGFVVAQLAEIVKPDAAADQTGYDQARTAVARSISGDIGTVFVDALRRRAEPRINQQAFDSVVQTHDLHPKPPPDIESDMNVSVTPGYAAFRLAYDAGRGSLVWRKTVADLETPVAAFLKLAHGQPNTFLLESVEGGAARGRYSIIGMQPDLIWRCQDGRASVNRHALSAPHAFVAEVRRAARQPARADRRNPAGGAAASAADGRRAGRLPGLRHGAADGDAAGEEPRHHRRARGHHGAPDPVCDLRQRQRRTDPGDAGVSGRRCLGRDRLAACPGRLDAAEAALERPLPHQPPPVMLPDLPAPGSNFSQDEFIAGVARCKEYIAAGDAFQIVLSQRFSVPFALPPFSLYRALRRINPAPFLFYLDFGGFSIVGSSPEVLVRLRDGIVTVRPLAGTRRARRYA